MKGLPVNIVNLICEWRADSVEEWIPFFCPKTHKLSWKVNNYCDKWKKNGDIILRNRLDSYMMEGVITLVYNRNVDFLHTTFKAVLWQYVDGSFKMYIEFDSEIKEDKKDKYIYRAMIDFEGGTEGGSYQPLISQKGIEDVYLNGTQYGMINWATFEYSNVRPELTIQIDRY